MSNTGLEINNLFFNNQEDTFSLKDINISVEKGKVLSLVGVSGCGKSTLLRLIAGLEVAKSGAIKINNTTICNENKFLAPEKRSVGLIFQHNSLFPHKSVLENVKIAVRGAVDKNKVACELLETFDMLQYRESFPYMLSSGQQQRVTIARALAQDPTVMLLDEPFSNLDTYLKRTLKRYIFDLLRTRNITTIVVTHDPEEALEIGDYVAFIDKGSIIQMGSSMDIYCNPRNYFVANFFSELISCKNSLIVQEDNTINSIFGVMPVNKKFKIGSNVLLCMRPEAIIIDNSSSIKAEVISIKFHYCYLRLNGDINIYKAKIPIAFLPNIGQNIGVRVDTKQIFTFSFTEIQEESI